MKKSQPETEPPQSAIAARTHRAAALDAVLAGPPGELTLGVTGHLLLGNAEEHKVARYLREEVLPRLLPPGMARPVCLLTGLAPGADLLFVRIARVWLHELGAGYRIVGLLPVPLEFLLEDWLDQRRAAGEQVPAQQLRQMRREIEQLLAGCAAIVQLMPAAAGPAELRSETFRQRQYQRLGACLAERSEVLIAVLRPDNALRPGGTAEVVHWRRNPHAVPAELSTWPAQRGRLIVIDPGHEPGLDYAGAGHGAMAGMDEAAGVEDGAANHLAARAEEALRAGNYVLCHDLATRGERLDRHSGRASPRLQYLSLLALANAGSADLAWQRYGALELAEAGLDEDWLALKGRLLKERARNGGRPADYEPAALAYLAAYRRTGGHFAAVNAASTYLLAGLPARARELAQEVLRLTECGAPDDELARYYWLASRAEAALVGGDPAACLESLRQADRLVAAHANARSRTRAQLRLLCQHLQIEDQFSSALGLPPLYYLAHAESAERISPDRCGAASADDSIQPRGAQVFAPLLQPADLSAAEYFLECGARLRLLLPASAESVVARWHHDYGAGWTRRLSAALERAAEMTVLHGFLEPELHWAERYIGAIACGLARLSARQLGGACQRVEISAADSANLRLRALDEEPEVLAPALQLAPSAQQPGTRRRFVGLLFADIAGFRRLPDDEMPRFWAEVMGNIALLLAAHGPKVLFRHTWGDAINVVTADAATAADIALAVLDCINRLRARESGMLGRIDLRLAAHFAPVYEGHDPIENGPSYYGSQLSLAARVEPVTPPGTVFMTEPFAASLALEAPERFALHYAGEIELAKNFGKYRLFNLGKA